MIPFDTGPKGTFKTLCESYPGDTVYKGSDGFRSLWGPIFYRGRTDGSARLLVIGQDPAQTEAFTRRILSGQAGRRVQGFVEKLGYSKSSRQARKRGWAWNSSLMPFSALLIELTSMPVCSASCCEVSSP